MTWAEECKEWRARMGFTQKEAAAFLEVNKRTYEEWEGGRHQPDQQGPIRKFMGLTAKRLSNA